MRPVAAAPRPLNHTKIYSDGRTKWGSGTPKDGIERFWQNLIGGAASCRFHRPAAGIGLNGIAKACIRSARKVETLVKFWDLTPHLELLSNRDENEAYLAAKPGKQYVLYFTDGGSIDLSMTGHPGDLKLKWIDISTGEWAGEAKLSGGGAIAVNASAQGPWVAVIIEIGDGL